MVGRQEGEAGESKRRECQRQQRSIALDADEWTSSFRAGMGLLDLGDDSPFNLSNICREVRTEIKLKYSVARALCYGLIPLDKFNVWAKREEYSQCPNLSLPLHIP